MENRTVAAFVSALVGCSVPFLCHAGNVCDSGGSAGALAEVAFQVPLETLVTTEEMGLTILNCTKIRVHFADNVFKEGFLPHTRVYLRDVRSPCEMLEMFSQATGLNWRMLPDGAVEVFRRSERNLHSVVPARSETKLAWPDNVVIED